MGRPPLPVGTAGKIGFLKISKNRVRARVQVRDYDGITRPVTRYGPSRAAAERRLKEALRDRRGPTGDGRIAAESRFRDVAQIWLDEIKDAELAEGSVETYTRTLNGHVLKSLGELLIRECSVSVVDRFLKAVKKNHGVSAAKNAKTVSSLVLALAVRHGALDANPVRDVAKIKQIDRSRTRALTVAEEADLLKKVRREAGKNPKRVSDEAHLDDLVTFMLGTGVRIGEALAVRRSVIDLDNGVIEINATVVRITGKGAVLQERAKSDAGWRVIAIPDHIVDLLRRRLAETATLDDGLHQWVLSPTGVWKQAAAHELGLIFPTPANGVRNPSNAQRGLRAVLDRVGGYDWVVPHTFRKTVATRLDEAGLSAREIADHLGHARPSMTQDVYMGRGLASSQAAKILDKPSP